MKESVAHSLGIDFLAVLLVENESDLNKLVPPLLSSMIKKKAHTWVKLSILYNPEPPMMPTRADYCVEIR